MRLSPFLHPNIFLPQEFLQTVEVIITFVSLYAIIFYLLMTADDKKYFKKQK